MLLYQNISHGYGRFCNLILNMYECNKTPRVIRKQAVKLGWFKSLVHGAIDNRSAYCHYRLNFTDLTFSLDAFA